MLITTWQCFHKQEVGQVRHATRPILAYINATAVVLSVVKQDGYWLTEKRVRRAPCEREEMRTSPCYEAFSSVDGASCWQV